MIPDDSSKLTMLTHNMLIHLNVSKNVKFVIMFWYQSDKHSEQAVHYMLQ